MRRARTAGVWGSGGLVMGFVFCFMQHLEAGDHCLEIVPARQNYLQDMNEEEQTITDRQYKMNYPGTAVAAENGGEPAELYGFIDGQPRQDGAQSHDNDPGIGDLLRAIVFDLGRYRLADVQVMQEHEPGFLKRAPVGEQIAPFAAEQGVADVYQSIHQE